MKKLKLGLPERLFVPVNAQIDLKHAVVSIIDGYTGPGGTNPSINNPPITDPSTAPTVSVTGGGSTGGALQAGAYFVAYTWLDANGGETLSKEVAAAFTVAAGNIPRVTLPALPTGAVGANIYLTQAAGLTGTETLYLTNVRTTAVDLPYATVTGGAILPAANTTGGYNAGTNRINIDGAGGIVGTGTVFKIPGDDESYEVLEHQETGIYTTQLLIAPTLRVRVDDDATITIAPHKLAIKIGEGTLTYDEKRKMQYILDRGLLDTVREGDQEPVDVRFDFIWEFLKAVNGSGTPTIEDALKQRGEASNWVSTSDDPCEPYCVDIVIEYDPPCLDEPHEVITLSRFRWESMNHEIKQGIVAVTGKCNIIQADIQRVF